MDLSMTIDSRIETDKIGTSMRHLIGMKYITEYLWTKYSRTPKSVYLKERRRAIKQSSKYLSKTANGINCYGKMSKLRGNLTAKCPVCYQNEDWLHVIKCGSTKEGREQFLDDITRVQYQDQEGNDRFRLISMV